GDGVFVPGVIAKPFTTIEYELGLERRQAREQRAHVVADADHVHVVATGHQRARDVVFGLFDLLLDFLLVFLVAPFGMRRIEDHGDLHVVTRAMSRPTVFKATRMTRPPTKP